MKARNHEFIELLLLTILFAVGTVVAIVKQHPRMLLMIVLTAFMVFLTFLSRFRHQRKYKTLHAKGRRRRTTSQHT